MQINKMIKKSISFILALILTVSSFNYNILADTEQPMGLNVAKKASLDIPDMTEDTKKIIDGDIRVGWQAQLKSNDPENMTDRQDWILDLKDEYNIDLINLYWESSCAKKYDVLVSSDKDNWTTVQEIIDGKS